MILSVSKMSISPLCIAKFSLFLAPGRRVIVSDVVSEWSDYVTWVMWCVVVGSIEMQCQQQQQVTQQTVDVSDMSPSYLSSYVSEQTHCGSFDSPWRLVAPPGRRLRVYLLDFASHDTTRSQQSTAPATCQVTVTVTVTVFGHWSRTLDHTNKSSVYRSLSVLIAYTPAWLLLYNMCAYILTVLAPSSTGQIDYAPFLRYRLQRAICYRPSVCLSVRLSHGWISQTRLKLGSCNFHHRVAPWL